MEARKSFTLRLPADTHQWLAQKAAASRRTVTAEIMLALDAAMAAEANSRPNGGAPAAGQASQA